MTPKEFRNLKRLIKSGDEDNIRLALELVDSNKTALQLNLYLNQLYGMKTWCIANSSLYWEDDTQRGDEMFKYWDDLASKIESILEILYNETQLV